MFSIIKSWCKIIGLITKENILTMNYSVLQKTNAFLLLNFFKIREQIAYGNYFKRVAERKK